MNKTYSLFHCHSDYSLLDSVTNFKDYVDLSVNAGSKVLSISEHGRPLNWTEKWAACKEAKLKYIHSVEIYLTESLDEKVRDNYHTILMAKNIDGILELNSLVSMSNDPDHFYYNNRISFDEFLNISDNIITTSACLASPLNKLSEAHPRYFDLANKYTFLEVQPHLCDDQVAYNKRLLLLSKKYGIPLIAGTDTHSSSKYKAECRDILLRAKRKKYSDDEFDLSYKSYDELVEMFDKQGAISESDYLEAIENTNNLFEMTDEIELDTSIKYPILYGTREADSKKFTETVYEKFNDKLDKGVIPKDQEDGFKSSIKEEMRVFEKLNMNGFMLSMSELLSWCRENDIAVGAARGSVGGSRVAYVTDVIDLNPETWHTVFSRFANEDRVEIGDIDIDCIESDRPKIFKYIIDRFGKDKTARVASFGTLAEKSVIDEVGRALMYEWNEKNGRKFDDKGKDNPYHYDVIKRIKDEFSADKESAVKKYPEIFYYYDGLAGAKISQSVHPAGMVISPITLHDNFGTFDKDGDTCFVLDMKNVHDYTGLAKYDFLVLKTVKVIKDTCLNADISYPRSHEFNWEDESVWNDMSKNTNSIFQFESKFASDSLKKFKPKNMFDMSLVTACIRPSGASYRDKVFKKIVNKNPSEMIDELLKSNFGYLVYQEDTIKFLQEICGLSGSESDNIRRAIGRKDRERLDKAMPSILEGYCSKSNKPRSEAEEEAKEFLNILSDSADYQFGYNHSIAYCMLGYICAYFRYYYPLEYITSFLNNAANDDDICNGTELARYKGIKITMPKYGISRSNYSFDKESNIIAKGLESIKFMNQKGSDALYDLSKENEYEYFSDLLYDVFKKRIIDRRQLDILIKIDYFSMFGNQRELFRILSVFDKFGQGELSKIKRENIDGTQFEPIVRRYATCIGKNGNELKTYTLLDTRQIMRDCEAKIRDLKMDDLSIVVKAKNFEDVMGYPGYTTGEQQDRSTLFVKNIFELYRKRDNKQFGYSIITQSLGSGKEGRFTVFNKEFKESPIKKGDIIKCLGYQRDDKGYYKMTSYRQIYS